MRISSTSFTILAAASAFVCTSAPLAAQCATDRVSVDSAGVESDGDAGLGSPNVNRNYMSADGRIVAFFGTQTNLVTGDTNGVADVFTKDRTTGATTRISVDSSGVQGDGASSDPAVSADGRMIAFQSSATNLVAGDTNGRVDVFVRDTLLGTTVRVSVSSSGIQGDGDSGRPDISADGRFVAFHSRSANLAAVDTNTTQDVFVHDLATHVTTCVSLDSAGVLGNAFSGNPALSANGRYVAFHSDASNLVALDTNGTTDVFVRDLTLSLTTRVSTSTANDQGDYYSQTPSISADGRYVAFSSAATNLVSNDTNNLFDVFVKDRSTNVTTRASVDSGGAQGNSVSQANSISADGRYVAFLSNSSNLVLPDTNGGPFNLNTDVFVRDMVEGSTERLSVNTSGSEGDVAGSSFNPCVAPDGSAVAFYSGATNLAAGGDNNGFLDVFVRSCGAPPPPTHFCSGDGSGTACPCGNAGFAGRGCQNSFLTGGGNLDAYGSSSVSNDTFTLSLNGLPPMAAVLFFQGDDQVAGGAGIVFGSGLRCVGGATMRLGIKFCQAGAAQWGPGAGNITISNQGSVPGGTTSIRHYQAWYRDVGVYCNNSGYNLTNGLTVTWIP